MHATTSLRHNAHSQRQATPRLFRGICMSILRISFVSPGGAMPPRKHDAPRTSSSTIHHTAAGAAAAASAPAPAPPARSIALRPPASDSAASTPSAQQAARAVSTPSTQSHAAHSNASRGGVGDARTAAAPLPHTTAAAALQRSPSAPSAPAAHASAASSSSAAHTLPSPPSSAPARRGRIAETSSDRTARVLRRRAEFVAGIRARVDKAIKGGQTQNQAREKLQPLAQILPSPPEWLIHQLAVQWMPPVSAGEKRGATLRLHLRDSFRGTDLQMLCAMAGLPVLPSPDNKHIRMRQYIFAAVRAYALGNPDIFPAAAAAAGAVTLPSWWWENDPHSNAPEMTGHTRAAIAQAVRSAVDEVEGAPAILGIIGNIIGNAPQGSADRPPNAQPPAYVEAASESAEALCLAAAMDESRPRTHPNSPSLSVSNDSLGLGVDPPLIGRLPALDASSEAESEPNEASSPRALQEATITPAATSSLRTRQHTARSSRQLPSMCLHPDSPVSSVEISSRKNLPWWVREALQATMGPSSKSAKKLTQAKQRLIIAAAAAIQLRMLSDKQLREDYIIRYTMAELIAPSSSAPLGRGVNSDALKMLCADLKYHAPSSTEQEKIDAGMRILLRHSIPSIAYHARSLRWLKALESLATTKYDADVDRIEAGAVTVGTEEDPAAQSNTPLACHGAL